MVLSKPSKTSGNDARSTSADAFCDCSARNELILDFSKDSASLGRPLDDTMAADVRKYPKVPPRGQDVRECRNMSES